MKKLYMILAAMTLLSMSLNAQLLPEFQRLKVDKTQTTELRNGKHFNVSQSPNRSNAAEGKCNQPGSLQMKGKNGKMMAPKAPLKVLNDGEYYVGPYTTDEFSTNGLGFGDQYNQDQSILLGVILNRSEFEEHIGDEIVGFRFALAGTGVLPVFEFAMLPYHDDESSLYFDQDNLKEWGMEEWNQPTTTTSNVTFTPENGYNQSTSITSDGVTISTTSGELTYYSNFRFYSGSTTTISVASGTITSIQFTGVNRYAVSNWTASTGTLSTSGNNGTWTGNAQSVSFTASSQVRCTQIVVTVTDTSTPTYQILNCGQWHEYRLSEPIEFNVASDVTKLFLGYSYYQELTSGSNFEHYPIAVNPNSTGHDHMALMYADASSTSTPNYQRSWWLWDFSGVGDLAVQLIFKSELEKTATPTITVTPGSNAYTVTATGNGTVTLTVGDQTVEGQGTVTITVPVTPDDQNLTATATAQEEGKRVSDPATQAVNIPGAGRTPMPTINVVWNGDQCTITATGNGEVHMYIDGVEVDQPYIVEEGSTAKTIVVTATAQEDGLAISNTATRTVEIPALNTSGWDQLDGTYSSNQNVDFGKILFVDRFSVSTANDEHPYGYDYVMKETKGQKRKTNTVPVEVQHTGVDVGAYATLDQVNLDVDRQHVALDVLNAEQKLYLSPSSKIFYYTLQRGQAKNTRPTSYMSVMQRQGSGNYMELLGTGGNNVSETEGVPAATFYYRMDDRDVTTGIYGQDFMAYVPVVWTYGYDRVGYNPNDPVHNSYGAPIWRTGAGMVANIHGQVQAQTGSKWTVWNDPNGKKCCLFRAHLDADGLLPSDGSDTINVNYEPYMFRIWVVCDSLRNYSVAESGFMVDGGAYGDTIMWLADVPCRYIEDLHAYDQHLNYGNIDQQESYTNQLVFGANAGSHPTFIIRFYYRAADHTAATAGMRGNRDGGGNGYGAAEGGYDPGNPGTGITEAQYEGTVVSQTYYNAQGMKSDKPFDGLNIIVTRYSDGTTSTTKVMR